MPPRPKRDYSYYLPRLREKRPDIAARLDSGDIKSVYQALIEAGIKRKADKPTLERLQALWRKASPNEKIRFKAFIRNSGRPPATLATLRDGDGRLSEEGRKRMEALQGRLSVGIGDVNHQMGLPKSDPRLGWLLKGSWSPPDDYLETLAFWITWAENINHMI